MDSKKIFILNVFLLVIAVFSFSVLSCDTSNQGDDSSDDTFENLVSYVGKGYDIFSPYADSTQIKSAVLDYDVMEAAGIIERTNIDNADYYAVSGKSVSEYLSSYQVEAGVSTDVGIFSGTLTSKFGTASYTNLTTAYATYSNYDRKYKEKVDNVYNNADSLRPYLTSTAREALDSVTSADEAMDCFRIYGTHVILWDYQGARLDYHATTTSTDSEFVNSFSSEVEASFKTVSGSASVDGDWSESEFNSRTNTQLRVYGGASEYTMAMVLSSDYSDWMDSISDSSTWTLCDFGYDGSIESLMPIWDLCSDDDDGVDEKALFEEAFETWTDSKEVDVDAAEPSSWDVTFYLDEVMVFVKDSENNYAEGMAEFQGSLILDGGNLWSVSGEDEENDSSHWNCAEDEEVSTDVSSRVDSSSRYSRVERNFTDSDFGDDINLRVSNLTEVDSGLDPNDSYSATTKSYDPENIITWDGSRLYIKATDDSDSDNYVKFYISIEVEEIYD